MSTEKTAPEERKALIEIYVRFNDDMEKDYCFQVAPTAMFRDLLDIFKLLPISLRPSVFYHSNPVGFYVSTAPGYLTEDGHVLFSYEVWEERFMKKVALDDVISQHCWPGQLVVPIWEHKDFAFYSFVAFLLVWLYTDLPDFLSPTPGLCLTNQMSNLTAWALRKFGYDRLAQLVIDDVQGETLVGAQCFFFVFHIIKVAAIFFLIYTGQFNPRTLNRFVKSKVPPVTREKLVQLGWTGSKRANADEYKDYYRDYKIKEYGGMVAAHQAGLFQRLKKLGVFLGEGEGYNTPLSPDTRLGDAGEKLVLSYEYFAKLGSYFEQTVQDKEPAELTAAIKQFRRYGFLHSDDEIRAIVAARKTTGDSRL